MPVKSDELATGPGWHAVQFYRDDEELAVSVSSYLAEGLLAEEPALIVATLPHRLAFEAELGRAGVDVDAAVTAGQLKVLDAGQTLRRFCADGQIDRDRFDATVGRILGPVKAGGQPVRIYAEMVALLWDSGHVAAAIELEAMWNDAGSRFPFALLCAYPTGLVAGEAAAAPVAEVCRLHTGVEAVRTFPQALQSARAARNFVLDALGLRDHVTLAMEVAIVTAELAANAVLHARSDFTVAASRSAAGMRISVRDGMPLPVSDGQPLPVRHRHGLWLVDKVADDWAVDSLPDGKIIWAEVSDRAG